MGIVLKFESRAKKSFVLDNKDEKCTMDIEKNRMLEIEKKVKNILFKANILYSKLSYIDIVSIVQKDNFVVIPQIMNRETTGCLFINDTKKKKRRLILVNKHFENPDNEYDVVFKKSRFITAHEYGHFILHKEKSQTMFAHRDTHQRTVPKDLEADYFARSILMPLNVFVSLYDYYNEEYNGDKEFVIYILSQLFKVTRNKVNKRIEDIHAIFS